MSTNIFILFILLLLSAFFSASETAITSLSRLRVRRLLEQGKRGSRSLLYLRENPARMLSTILVGNNLANVIASVFVASLFLEGFKNSFNNNVGLIIGLASVLMTFLLLTFGEIIPKTIAIRNAEGIALWVSPLIVILEVVFRPIAYVVTFISRPFVYFTGSGKAADNKPILTEAEIKMILSVGEKEGVIEEDERQMISSIFDISDTVVREVMTPKPDMHCVEVNQSAEAVIKVISDTGHSRIPIFEGSLDNIIGVVYSKDLIQIKGEVGLRDFMKEVLFVPETKKVDDLLREMQSARTHMAIVVDEYGSTAGLVTLEDLIEEIVGEIHDEFEKGEKSFEKTNENTAIVDGGLTISDLSDFFGIDFPKSNIDTVAGFVISQLGKVPAVGDVVRYGNIVISVERVHKRRITRLKIVKEVADPTQSLGVGG